MYTLVFSSPTKPSKKKKKKYVQISVSLKQAEPLSSKLQARP